ncbi:MAG: FtsX-like permease family protein [Pseudomonadota bacterium]
MIWKLAWRSFLRHKRRSIITAAAISLGLAMMIIFVGVGDDGHIRMAKMGIRMGSGHIVIQGKGYQQEQTLDYLITDPARLIEIAGKIQSIVHIVPRVKTGGLISSGEHSSAVMIVGVDPKIEKQASDIPSDRKRIAGKYLRSREEMSHPNDPADIYIGAGLAKNLNVELGDRVVITASPKGKGRPASAAFHVRGVFRSGISELDSFYAEIPLLEAQELLNLGKQVSQVALILQNIEETLPITAFIKKQLGENKGLEILSWQEALKELYDAIVLDDASLYFMMAIIFVIVALGIFNTVFMSVLERTRQFGVMMALGTAPRHLFATVMTESFILAIVGAVVGLCIGLGLHFWVATVGIDVTALTGGGYEFAGINFEGMIYSHLTTWVVIKWTLVVIGIVVASALYPALRAASRKPVEAMRHV